MNGTDWKKTTIKEKLLRKKQNFKIIASLFVTNALMVLLLSLCSPAVEDSPPEIISHPLHTKITVPLQIFAQFQKQDTERPVTIYTSDKKLLIKKAYLHSLPSQDFSSLGPQNSIIEIPDREITKLVEHQQESLVAYPCASKQISPPKEHQYEIIF